MSSEARGPLPTLSDLISGLSNCSWSNNSGTADWIAQSWQRIPWLLSSSTFINMFRFLAILFSKIPKTLAQATATLAATTLPLIVPIPTLFHVPSHLCPCLCEQRCSSVTYASSLTPPFFYRLSPPAHALPSQLYYMPSLMPPIPKQCHASCVNISIILL